MKTAVMTDSNSGITPEEGKKIGIYSLPMPVIIEGDVFYEGKNITQEEYYGAMTSGKNVTTSQPSPGDVMDMWDEILNSGYDEIIYIPMSSGLSASCEAAMGLALDYDGKVQVANNHRISVTMRISVMEAKHYADLGASAAKIKELLETNAFNSSIYIAVDTLEFLKRGGRVTAAGAALGSVLNIKPVLTIQGERLDAFAKVRGMKKAKLRMIEALKNDFETRFQGIPKERLRLGAAGAGLSAEQEKEWTDMLSASFPEMDVYYDSLSFSISCHIGPGGYGVGISVIGEYDL